VCKKRPSFYTPPATLLFSWFLFMRGGVFYLQNTVLLNIIDKSSMKMREYVPLSKSCWRYDIIEYVISKIFLCWYFCDNVKICMKMYHSYFFESHCHLETYFSESRCHLETYFSESQCHLETYFSESQCHLEKAACGLASAGSHMSKSHSGACTQMEVNHECPMTCSDTLDPVCSNANVTYSLCSLFFTYVEKKSPE
jgi:hypothetical protein